MQSKVAEWRHGPSVSFVRFPSRSADRLGQAAPIEWPEDLQSRRAPLSASVQQGMPGGMNASQRRGL
jgi:hypothetical protein